MIPNTVTFGNQNLQDFQNNCDKHANKLLSETSPKDANWDKHRSYAQDTEYVYQQGIYSFNFGKYNMSDDERNQVTKWYKRVANCSLLLEFHENTAEDKLRLSNAFFCHHRNCPVCQWRKTLVYKELYEKLLKSLAMDYPNYRFIFLTLTVENCEIEKLRETLVYMHESWRKMEKRKEFSPVVGWVRTFEVTRDSKRPNTHAHPHYHIILMVKPSYFSHGYIKHSEWVALWQDCLGVNYSPSVRVQGIKPKILTDTEKQSLNPAEQKAKAIASAVAELVKYSIKPDEIKGDGSTASMEWFIMYAFQVHKMRAIATGGLIKVRQKELKNSDNITTGDMLLGASTDDEVEKPKPDNVVYFGYNNSIRKYKHRKTRPYYSDLDNQ